MLTEDEHLLCCLAEEAGEIVQAVNKALRFGLDDDYRNATPSSLASPRVYIMNEIADLVAVTELLHESHVLTELLKRDVVDAKKAKVRKFMDYARSKGTLEPEPETRNS